MDKKYSVVISILTMITMVITFIPNIANTGIRTVFAESTLYPVQAVNLSVYSTNRNLNVSENTVNTQKLDGSSSQNWQIEYVSSGVYNIINISNGQYLTANGTECITTNKNSQDTQNWNIIGVTTDFDGYFLYYKIINVSTGDALTYYQGSNTVALTTYTDDNAQKWKLNCYGLEGFASNCMVSEGEKAGTIGGLLGQTVHVKSVDEFKSALDSTEPLTVIVDSNLDCSSAGYIRIRDNKTILGSFNANTIQDCMLRTNNEYGKEGDNPSDNIIIKNIDFQAVKNNNKILIQIWSSRNIWIDHCTFNSQLDRNRDEVGKFIWINTPYDSYLDAKDRLRSPDYITISYNTFTNRYWTVAYGTQNDETTRCRTTLMYNLWDNCVRRCPQIGNGIGHIYNNYFIGNDNGNDSGTNQIISGDGSNMLSENCRFQSLVGKEITGNSDPYRDSGSYTSETSTSTPYELVYSPKVLGTWYPSNENYGYSLIDAYNTKGTDTKDFCLKYSGAFKSDSNIKYICDSECSTYIATKYESPFLTDSFESSYGSIITEYTPATLKEGAVYMIKNINSGLYMEVDSAKAENGANVQQWGADTSASHNTWRVLSADDGYYYLYPQISDKVSYLLDVESNKSENGTNIGIWSNTDADAQKFKFYQNSDGSYFILTKSSNDESCLAIESASKSSGANVIQWKVNLNDDSQKWELTQVEDSGCTMDTSKTYMFKNLNSGLYMEVKDGSAIDNANVQQWGANTSAVHNTWTLKEFGNGYYYIISKLADGTTYYLNSTGSADGSNIEILTNNGTSSHLFKFVKNPDGSYYILTRTSKDSSAIEVINADKSSGANVQQWPINGHDCQKWTIETVVEENPTETTTNDITDVPTQPTFTAIDILTLKKYILGITDTISSEFDLNNDATINILDLCIVKKLYILQ